LRVILVDISVLFNLHNGSLYLSVTPQFYTKVLHQTLNATDELWCKTLSRIMFGVKPRF